MASTPYFLNLTAVLTSNGTGSPNYPVPNNQTLHLNWVMVKSTGTFQFNQIRDSAGHFFSNSSASAPMDGRFFQQVGAANVGFLSLPVPFNILGGSIFYCDIQDTSGAGNTVVIIFMGSMDYPG